MDRRQRKTREAIFHAFTELLSKKHINKITVSDIIAQADVGRATFYAHFETKDQLLEAFCQELFCHLFDSEQHKENGHRHIFHCESSGEVFAHLFQHLKNNDNQILTLLSSENNRLFLQYFRQYLEKLVRSHASSFAHRKAPELPEDFWQDHIVDTFLQTLSWWVKNGAKETPAQITGYFFKAV